MASDTNSISWLRTQLTRKALSTHSSPSLVMQKPNIVQSEGKTPDILD